MGQFRTVWYKILCYNGRVKEDGSGLSFVYEFFPLNGFFAGCRTVCLARNARHAPQKVIGTLPTRIEPLKGVAQCRTMSHDAQVNTCYNVNCQRRTRAHTLPGATRTQKVVTECHQKSRDRRVNTCYNANW